MNAIKNEAASAYPQGASGQFDQEIVPSEGGIHSAAQRTPQTIKSAVQELLRSGVVQAQTRATVFDTLRQFPQEVAQALEPLDLQCQLDEVRGLAWLAVGQGFAGDDAALSDSPADAQADGASPGTDGGWTHPLVRRQRLTLEQSLLLALLRQHYLQHEQQAGMGGGIARVGLAELGAELATHLGDSGSDRRDDKRLRQLLAVLKEHGVVGEVQDNGQVPVLPLIAHLANPASLQALLRQYLELGHHEGGAR